MGGTDTSSISLAWIFAILLHHPDVVLKIQEEIDGFIQKNNRRPVFADREDFPYIVSVQKESLRYKPLGHFTFFHVLEKDSMYYFHNNKFDGLKTIFGNVEES